MASGRLRIERCVITCVLACVLTGGLLGACASGPIVPTSASLELVRAPDSVNSIPGPVRVHARLADGAGGALRDAEVSWFLLASDGAVPLGSFVGAAGARVTDAHVVHSRTDGVNGESWVDVASGGEGTVRLMARATGASEVPPLLVTLDWVDLDWILYEEQPRGEAAWSVGATVTRASDGEPVAGYVLDATITAGAAVFDHGGVRRIARTGADGGANVRVEPAVGWKDGDEARVSVTLLRPEDPARGWSELVISRFEFVLEFSVFE